MSLLQDAIVLLVRPWIRHEMPGWGRIYRHAVGGHNRNPFWVGARPRIVRDKRTGYLRLVFLSEWADRSFFFLGRWYDLKTQLALEVLLREGDRVVDVGANYGHFSLAAAALVGPTGHVHAFEPNPATFARLQVNLMLNPEVVQVAATNAGLGDREGELDLMVPSINSGGASFAGSRHVDTTVVRCPVLVGDQVLGPDPVRLVKIDVEGFELRVLRGLARTISRDRPWIITEVRSSLLALDGVSVADLARFLGQWGYRPLRLDVTGRPGRRKRLVLHPFDPARDEGDVLWVPEGGMEDLTAAGPLLAGKSA